MVMSLWPNFFGSPGESAFDGLGVTDIPLNRLQFYLRFLVFLLSVCYEFLFCVWLTLTMLRFWSYKLRFHWYYTFALLLKIHLRFRDSFLRFHSMAGPSASQVMYPSETISGRRENSDELQFCTQSFFCFKADNKCKLWNTILSLWQIEISEKLGYIHVLQLTRAICEVVC